MSDHELFHKYIDLMDQKAAIKQAEKDIKEELAMVEAQLLEQFEDMGMSQIKTKAQPGRPSRTVHLHRMVTASVVGGKTPELCSAMKAIGMGALVKETVNHQTLGSWARDQERDKDDLPILPPELAGIVSVFEKISVRVRKA